MYNNPLELGTSSMAPQLCLPIDKSLKTDEGVNSRLLAGVYEVDQPSDFPELKSLDKIGEQSRAIIARDQLDGRSIKD